MKTGLVETFDGVKAYCTWEDGTWARITPINGDPLASYEILLCDITFLDDEDNLKSKK